MSKENACPKCGAEIPSDAPAGQCPQCMMNAGFESRKAASTDGQPADPNERRPRFEAPSPEELAPRFPQFEIVELLGKGGMGAVYKARQPKLDRYVALKILPPEIGADPGFTERFMREAQALAMLNHSSIVAVYDFGEADGLYFFVMEYVDGANLRTTIEAGGLTPPEALAIVPQICEALQFAHDEGVVHRDIKPENILIDKRGRIKIADFGLAKLLGLDADDSAVEKALTLTGTHQVMGTPRYMAPEQIQGSNAVDHRADIYSLGVVFYEMLTGELPAGRFAPPSKRVHIDVRLDEVVLRTLEATPDRRYQHASDVKNDVESIVSAADTQSQVATPDTAEFKSIVRSRLKIPACGILVAGIVNLLAALTIVLLPVFFPVLVTDLAEPTLRKSITLLVGLGAFVSLVLSIIMLLGSARMFDLQNWGVAAIAAFGAIVPCAVGFPISLPFGIWALVVLSRQDVRTAFADWDAEAERERGKLAATAVGWAMSVGMIAGLTLGAAFDRNNLGVYLVLGMILGLLVGCVIEAQNRRKSQG